LLPLPTQDFEVKYYKKPKSSALNNHIYLSNDKTLLPVLPFCSVYAQNKTRVIYTRSTVKGIFGDNGNLIGDCTPDGLRKSEIYHPKKIIYASTIKLQAT